MKNIENSKPFSFFLEFLLVLFFFAISMMIVFRIYTQAALTHREDAQRLQALTYARTQIQNEDALVPGTYGLSEDMKKEGSFYQVVIKEEDSGYGTFSVYKGETELVVLTYFSKGEGL